MPQWKQYSGNWTVTQQMQARGGDEWPTPPGAPTIGTATAGDASATVTFTAPANLGIPAVITQYTVTSSPGGLTATGSASPIVVTGLSNGTAYTFTVTATNATGTGPASAASNSVTAGAGSLYAAGFNNVGQLGTNNTISRSSPVQVGSDTNWLDVATSATNSIAATIAIKSDNTMWGWGSSSINGTGTTYSSPVQVGALTNWKSVKGGFNFFLATKTDGTLWAWGLNGDGQLGQNDTSSRDSPVQVGNLTDWAYASAGYTSSFAIKTDGTLWSWGRNNNGGLGINTVYGPKSSPTQVGALTNWRLVAGSGYSDGAIALKTDGTLWAWGNNDAGQLGQNDRIFRSSPVQIGALTNWSGISANGNSRHFNMTKTDGTLWGLGGPASANGTNGTRSSPTQVGSLTTWDSTYAGYEAGFAIKADGTLWAWGSNNQGQLGNNNVTTQNTPIQIGSSSGWLRVSSATTSNGFSMFIKN